MGNKDNIFNFKDKSNDTKYKWLSWILKNNEISGEEAYAIHLIDFESGGINANSLSSGEVESIKQLDIWKTEPKKYIILEKVTWELFADVFLYNGCVIEEIDKQTFISGEISTEEYDEFIINKLLEAGYIEEWD